MSQVAHRAVAFAGFLSIKQLEAFLSLDGMMIRNWVTPSFKFAGTHLYSRVERGTSRVKCYAQEHKDPIESSSLTIMPAILPLLLNALPIFFFPKIRSCTNRSTTKARRKIAIIFIPEIDLVQAVTARFLPAPEARTAATWEDWCAISRTTTIIRITWWMGIVYVCFHDDEEYEITNKALLKHPALNIWYLFQVIYHIT